MKDVSAAYRLDGSPSGNRLLACYRGVAYPGRGPVPYPFDPLQVAQLYALASNAHLSSLWAPLALSLADCPLPHPNCASLLMEY